LDGQAIFVGNTLFLIEDFLGKPNLQWFQQDAEAGHFLLINNKRSRDPRIAT
jgi:hypothetical protein